MQQFASMDSPLAGQLNFALLSTDEKVNEAFIYTVVALSPRPDIDFKALLGQHVTVKLAQSPLVSLAPRFFDGMVERVAATGRQGRHYRYTLTLRPWFWFLSQTQDCKVFQNKTVLQMVEEVLADHPFAAFEVRTTASYTPWLYCVQYRESDFNFLSRLMEQEGISYHFEHSAGKHVMVLTDSAVGHPENPGCKALPVRLGDAAGVSRGDECITGLVCSQRVQPGVAVLQDYDFTRSQLDISRNAAHSGEHAVGDMEVFNYPGLYDKEADGEHFVQMQMEEYAAHGQAIEADTDARGMACGGLITVRGSQREADNAEHLVLGTEITVIQPDYEGGGDSGNGGSYSCHFHALPTSVPFRGQRKTSKPTVAGPQTAVVVGPAGEEIHTDSYGRVRVQFHWDRYGQKNEKSSCWVRVSTPWAGKNFGFVQIPRIGQEVVVDFLEGDPDQPLITGRVYNAQQMPPWDLPANATQSGVLTRSSKDGAYANANALRFEDKKGEEQLWLHAEKDQLIEVENDEKHWVGHDRVKNIDRHETTTVKGNRTETVNQNETITINQNRKERVDMDETVSIGLNRSEDVGINETVSIGANRSVTIGANKTETVAMAKFETIGALKALTIGAAYQTTVGAFMNTSVALYQNAQIGQDKNTKVGANYNITVTDKLTITVGKASLVMASDGTITLNGKDINIGADATCTITGEKIQNN